MSLDRETVHIAGTWALVAYELRRAGGTLHEPFGPRPVGLLMYGSDGHMSAQLARPGRAAAGAETYIAYAGTYELDEGGTSVAHRIVISLEPAWIGRTLRRAVRLTGDALVLTAVVPERGGGTSRHVLSWRRISPSPPASSS